MKLFTAKNHPRYDPDRKKWQRKCNQCGYPAPHRIYVCVKCGNCQNCAGFNPNTQTIQHCIWCGNGRKAARPDVPEVAHEPQPLPDGLMEPAMPPIKNRPTKRAVNKSSMAPTTAVNRHSQEP